MTEPVSAGLPLDCAIDAKTATSSDSPVSGCVAGEAHTVSSCAPLLFESSQPESVKDNTLLLDPDALNPSMIPHHNHADGHDGNVSDGDGGEAVFRRAANGIGITRQVVHPEEHTEDEKKWSMKNIQKWKDTPPVSVPIGNSLFRACKIFRETDPDHSPAAFAAKHPDVGLVIDISGDTPSYDPQSLSKLGIAYRKLPTVSKIPPAREKVEEFIKVARTFWETHPLSFVSVHCHYGWNRTGFMICSFLIEELGMGVDEAIASFAAARPPKGIKHASFKQELHARYGRESSDASSSSSSSGTSNNVTPNPGRTPVVGATRSSLEDIGEEGKSGSSSSIEMLASKLPSGLMIEGAEA